MLKAFTASTCLGTGVDSLAASLRTQRSGLAPCAFETVRLDTFVGEVARAAETPLPSSLKHFECRNNRLAQLALRQDGFLDAVLVEHARYGAKQMGVFLGTSTSGIFESEIAYRHRDPATGALPPSFNYAGAHNTYSVAAFVRELLGIEGPAYVISTACSSSAKVFAAAQRMISAGIIDSALVGGVDSLCLTTLYGFHSLQLTSTRPCRPFAADRDGLSIGEAAAFVLLVRPDEHTSSSDVLLLGAGESSDAYHLSTPHPEGLGAQMAMRDALVSSGLRAEQIDYINLHGTATPSNDRAESRAVNAIFGPQVPCSSTKGSTGHTLGAAGALEAVISAVSITQGFMPGGINGGNSDPELQVNYLTRTRTSGPSRVMSNSFGFGGTNCSLILGGAR